MVKKFWLAIIMLMCALMINACQEKDDDVIDEPDDVIEELEISSFSNLDSPLDEKLGVTFWGAKYLPGLASNESSLVKAADEILELGSKVMKLAAGNLIVQYPLDSWNLDDINYAFEKFNLSPIKTVLEKPFKTFFISIPELKSINWRNGVDEVEAQYVNDEFYKITKYLLETYQGTGKTFILQNWESDNYIGNTNDQMIMSHFTSYINARQDGVNRARSEFLMSQEKNVFVFHAIEINRLSPSSYLRVVDEVIPYTYCDLYLYSSYEAKDKNIVQSENDVKFRLFDLLTLYKSKLPDVSNYPQTMYFGDNRLAISEFGYPDYADQYQGEWQHMVAKGHLLTQAPLKLQYLVYWQLTDNEVIGENASAINSLNPIELRNYSFLPGDLNGFYLIRPDGQKTYTYAYFKALYESNSLLVEVEIPTKWE